MEKKKHLLLLGDDVIEKEIVYLELRIKKALAGNEPFTNEDALILAKADWENSVNRYYTFWEGLQNNRNNA